MAASIATDLMALLLAVGDERMSGQRGVLATPARPLVTAPGSREAELVSDMQGQQGRKGGAGRGGVRVPHSV